jgi:hypothetical protein
MKANELRIGNWVMIDPSSIPQQVCDVMCDCVTTENTRGAHYGLVDAIPLTEEWLLKFGFEKTMSWTYVKDLVGNLKLVYYLGEKGWSIGFKSYSDFPNLKYVHQLQNLYFALTGEELTPTPIHQDN